jgi:sec-independent protein translocase protein TatA
MFSQHRGFHTGEIRLFGFSVWELLIFLAIVVLIFGSTRLPILARSIGQSITEFKKGYKGIEDQSEEKSER